MSAEMLFQCPHCQARTMVDASFVGQRGPCFQCGREVVIKPTMDDATRPSASPRHDPHAPPQTRTALHPPRPMGGEHQPGSAEDDWNRIRNRSTSTSGAKSALMSVLLAIVLVACLGGLGAGVYFVVLPALELDRSGEAYRAEEAHLKQVVAALQAYHAQYDAYPPPVVYDEAGKPMHSWRALLIPFLELPPGWETYRFDRAWDSTENAELHPLQCPPFEGPKNSSGASLHRTMFMLVVGGRTMFPANTNLSRDAASDGEELTLLVIQVQDSRTHWLDPSDVSFTSLMNGQGPELGSEHSSGTWYATVDGSTHWHDGEFDPEFLKSLSVRDDGSPIQIEK